MPTDCETCDLRHAVSKNRPPWRWICSHHPRLPWWDEIDDEGKWTGFDPFMRCIDINGGMCPDWTPKREDNASSDHS